jgi:hypothetical protein
MAMMENIVCDRIYATFFSSHPCKPFCDRIGAIILVKLKYATGLICVRFKEFAIKN